MVKPSKVSKLLFILILYTHLYPSTFTKANSIIYGLNDEVFTENIIF